MATADTDSAIRRAELDNGMTIVLEPMPWLPSASFQLLLPIGAVTDPDGREGSATVLNDWMDRGAGTLDSRALSDALDDLGVRRGGGAGSEFTTFSASLLASELPRTLELHAAIVRRPRLEDEEFDSARALSLQELASLDDNPTQRMFLELQRRFFLSNHGRNPYGSEDGIDRLEPEGLRADFARRVGPRGTILSVAGGVRWDDLLETAGALFGDWTGEGVPRPEVERAPSQREHVVADTSQVQIGIAFASLPPGSPGWYEYALAMEVLSGSGMGNRLFSEVREKRGLVYSVTALNRAVRGFGYTLAYAGTTPERAGETLDVLTGELLRLREGITDAEFARARTGILSQLVMQGESSGSRASSLARDTYLLGRARSLDEIRAAIEAVDRSDVDRFLAGMPQPEFTVLTLGPGQGTPALA